MVLKLTIDCADPPALVAFWSLALGYVPEPPPDGHATWRAYWQAIGVPPEELPEGVGDTAESIIDPTGKSPKIWFQRVPEPKEVKNRVHLDLDISDLKAPLRARKQQITDEVERLTEAGATVQRIMEPPDMDYYCVVMQDPEGNEFCVG